MTLRVVSSVVAELSISAERASTRAAFAKEHRLGVSPKFHGL